MSPLETVQCPVLVGRDDVGAWPSGGWPRRHAATGARSSSRVRPASARAVSSGRSGAGRARRASGRWLSRHRTPGSIEVPAALFLDLARTMRDTPALADVGQAIIDRWTAATSEGGATYSRAFVLDVVDRIRAVIDAPTVLVFEDLQWADDLSLEAIGELARRAGSIPLFVLAAYRRDETLPGTPLRDWRSRLLTQRLAEEVRLERLDLAQTATVTTLLLATGLPAPARSSGRSICARTGCRSTSRSCSRPCVWPAAIDASAIRDVPVPDSIEDAVLARLARRSPDARAVARAGAVIGRCFVPEVLAGVMDRPVVRTCRPPPGARRPRVPAQPRDGRRRVLRLPAPAPSGCAYRIRPMWTCAGITPEPANSGASSMGRPRSMRHSTSSGPVGGMPHSGRRSPARQEAAASVGPSRGIRAVPARRREHAGRPPRPGARGVARAPVRRGRCDRAQRGRGGRCASRRRRLPCSRTTRPRPRTSSVPSSPSGGGWVPRCTSAGRWPRHPGRPGGPPAGSRCATKDPLDRTTLLVVQVDSMELDAALTTAAVLGAAARAAGDTAWSWPRRLGQPWRPSSAGIGRWSDVHASRSPTRHAPLDTRRPRSPRIATRRCMPVAPSTTRRPSGAWRSAGSTRTRSSSRTAPTSWAPIQAEVDWAAGRWDLAMPIAEQTIVDRGCARAPAMAGWWLGVVPAGTRRGGARPRGPRWPPLRSATGAGSSSGGCRHGGRSPSSPLWPVITRRRSDGARRRWPSPPIRGSYRPRAVRPHRRPGLPGEWTSGCGAALAGRVRGAPRGDTGIRPGRRCTTVAGRSRSTPARRARRACPWRPRSPAGTRSAESWEATLARLDLASCLARSNRFAAATAVAVQARAAAERLPSPFLLARADELIRHGRGRIVEDDRMASAHCPRVRRRPAHRRRPHERRDRRRAGHRAEDGEQPRRAHPGQARCLAAGRDRGLGQLGAIGACPASRDDRALGQSRGRRLLALLGAGLLVVAGVAWAVTRPPSDAVTTAVASPSTAALLPSGTPGGIRDRAIRDRRGAGLAGDGWPRGRAGGGVRRVGSRRALVRLRRRRRRRPSCAPHSTCRTATTA